MNGKTLIETISMALSAYKRCSQKGAPVGAEDRWLAYLNAIEKYLPSGGGFDSGTKIDIGRTADFCNPDVRIYLATSFHHMDHNGYYDGWTHHPITVNATFSGFDLTIGGVNRNDIKELIAQTFQQMLCMPAPDIAW